MIYGAPEPTSLKVVGPFFCKAAEYLNRRWERGVGLGASACRSPNNSFRTRHNDGTGVRTEQNRIWFSILTVVLRSPKPQSNCKGPYIRL